MLAASAFSSIFSTKFLAPVFQYGSGIINRPSRFILFHIFFCFRSRSSRSLSVSSFGFLGFVGSGLGAGFGSSDFDVGCSGFGGSDFVSGGSTTTGSAGTAGPRPRPLSRPVSGTGPITSTEARESRCLLLSQIGSSPNHPPCLKTRPWSPACPVPGYRCRYSSSLYPDFGT